MNERLKELTVTAALTGLKNRRYLEELLPDLMTKSNLAVLMIDIDFFKRVTDTFRHHAADVVWKEVADLLTNTIGNVGFTVRMGREEFIAVFPEITVKEPLLAAEKIWQR